MREELRKYFRFAEVGKNLLVLLILRSPFDYLMTAYSANLMEQAFQAMEELNERRLLQVFIMFLIASCFLFSYNGIIWSLYAPFTVRMQGKVKKKLFSHISNMSYQSVSEVPCGEWVTRMNSDTQIASDLVGGYLTLPHAAIACFNVLVSSLVLVHLNLELFLSAVCFIVPHVILSQYLLARPMSALREKSQEKYSQLTCWLEPVITASEVVQIYDAKDYLHKKMEESSIELRTANMKIHRKNAIGNGLTPIFGMIGYLAMLVLGSIQINSSNSNFGELTKVIQYRGGLLLGIMMLLNSIINIRGNFAGVKRINEIIENKG